MLHRINIVALVGGGDRPAYPNNEVMMYDDSVQKVVGKLTFKN
jgi:hypothetical protein